MLARRTLNHDVFKTKLELVLGEMNRTTRWLAQLRTWGSTTAQLRFLFNHKQTCCKTVHRRTYSLLQRLCTGIGLEKLTIAATTRQVKELAYTYGHREQDVREVCGKSEIALRSKCPANESPFFRNGLSRRRNLSFFGNSREGLKLERGFGPQPSKKPETTLFFWRKPFLLRREGFLTNQPLLWARS